MAGRQRECPRTGLFDFRFRRSRFSCELHGPREPWLGLRVFLSRFLKGCHSTRSPFPRPPSLKGAGIRPCLLRVSLLLTLWVGGSGGGCCVDERRRGWGGVGSRLEGGAQIPDPSIGQTAKVGAGGRRGEKERRDTNTTVRLHTPNSTWIWGISGKALRWSDPVGREWAPWQLTIQAPSLLEQERVGGREGDRGMLQAKETLSAAASFKTDLL